MNINNNIDKDISKELKEEIRKELKAIVPKCRIRIKNLGRNTRCPIIFLKKRKDTVILCLRVHDKVMKDCLTIRFLAKQIMNLNITDVYISEEAKRIIGKKIN